MSDKTKGKTSSPPKGKRISKMNVNTKRDSNYKAEQSSLELNAWQIFCHQWNEMPFKKCYREGRSTVSFCNHHIPLTTHCLDMGVRQVGRWTL